jgi:peptidoglycan/xylan/chitin deacetylase (PgdA/CDA1 family)
VLFDHDLKGRDLPPRTLCLTYDDGPGPDTLELGDYLFGQGIRAAFFVIGRYATEQTDVLAKLSGWGHAVGNHTYGHPGLVALTEAGGDVVEEIARTDALLRPHVQGGVVFLRAPYGNWRQKDPETGEDCDVSVVADVLNHSGRFRDYVGPVNWDVSAADYSYWRRGASGAECARAYLAKIDSVGRGIVLMHDSSEDPQVRARNQVLQTTRLIVPKLKAAGYRFVGLDEVPQVRRAVQRVFAQAATGPPHGRGCRGRLD